MREIKFRGVRECDNKVVYGIYANIDGNHHIIESSDIAKDGHHFVQSSDNPTWVREDSIGQYSGLKDSNGVEIYEGDKIRYLRRYVSSGMSNYYMGKEPHLEYYEIKDEVLYVESIVTFSDGAFSAEGKTLSQIFNFAAEITDAIICDDISWHVLDEYIPCDSGFLELSNCKEPKELEEYIRNNSKVEVIN